ncbi:MAG: FmdB family zinc ribbon protein [Smithella sp.]|jgi:putative FmdB family regulatory protein
MISMPIYEFKCKKCKKIFESLILSPKEENKLSCPECGTKKPQKVMSVFAGGKSNGSTCSSTSCPPGCSCH